MKPQHGLLDHHAWFTDIYRNMLDYVQKWLVETYVTWVQLYLFYWCVEIFYVLSVSDLVTCYSLWDLSGCILKWDDTVWIVPKCESVFLAYYNMESNYDWVISILMIYVFSNDLSSCRIWMYIIFYWLIIWLTCKYCIVIVVE